MKEASIRQKLTEYSRSKDSLYEVIPVETKLEDGIPDTIVVRRSDGAVCLLELKFVRPKDKNLGVRINQAAFLRKWRDLCYPHTRSAVFAGIEDKDGHKKFNLYLAERNHDWKENIQRNFDDPSFPVFDDQWFSKFPPEEMLNCLFL